MNVLVTSAAAKVPLIQAFQRAAHPRGARVFSADLAAHCAAAHFSDAHFAVRRADAPGALEELIELCRTHAIGLIAPTRDGELAFFARHKARFAEAGVTVLVPDLQRLAVCQNKREFTLALAAVGLPAVPVIEGDPLDYPVFVRPATGAGGRGARRIGDPVEFAAALAECAELLVHPLITAPEYSIDLLMDLEGAALQAVVRERVLVVAGESKITRVVRHEALENMSFRLGETLGLIGHNTVQAFDDPALGPLFIEVNPRFGGASNCAIEAGLASPERLLALLAGDAGARAPRPIRYGLEMHRYSQDAFFRTEP